ncbi:MAG TPA: 3-oxoacyl-ACP reductase family protein [Deltaproteobacteria bacterium]|nr:3-oxoacyl-ACP reductase family protein [Deltaproteobacteria bacterium]HPR53746.1 3-oxoacyl-ACP reductase family protein [Deltaproteobacteria bacterium]
MTDQTLRSRISIVTGGTRGIGRAIVRALLQAGSNVVATYAHDASSAEETRSEFIRAGLPGDRFLIVRSDVSKRKDVKELLKTSCAAWGGPVSLLVNNAGILRQGDFFDLTEKQWDQTFATNLKGPFLLCQEAMPIMTETKDPSIVNIASIGGQTGGPRAPDYAASKAALICFTQSMARIGAPMGIRVNAVSPGWIDTGIFTEQRLRELHEEALSAIPLQRLGKPEEVAETVVFLLSKKASYITGHVLNVNGGMHF